MAEDATNELVKPQSSDEDPPKPCTPDDLIELVRAIKFAHTDMSIRNVHNEISVTMANSDESYAFLKDVKLNDVKKVWKKALKGSPETNNSTQKSEPTPPQTNTAKSPAVNVPIVPTDGIIRFYTVGDGSVKTLAENYANHHAEAAVAASQQQNTDIEKEKGKYTHFFLDVPADLSGSRPHQALINYQDNQKASTGKGKNKAGSKKKSAQPSSNEEGKEIFKIQLAALPPGMEDVPTPMLLYNSDRSAKTFLHPPSSPNDKDDDGGHFKIRKMITESGISGALGATGGQKAFFYGFITKTKTGPNVISIDIHSGLVPSQTW
mmetsp:Transcript_14077/g.30611  ORF Transcript_14077/g.30611 Transcript_14077/m.30611 type:complete len:321 (-) Transcript_14077:84-1046(-)|eukprot:CAMPEP_0172316604 /NCGR_PEP_ID=MMETSP1058-20130122/28795_1 /TAXON_ID=83371 /ORGANISM="Detonula confervacea, Strain CCMP 353" /LENGTH=320 /DNA_ID=CAMNT_0013030945 /DNA_START=79 /DNA_END=1038 /DNA_ORIENTATION=-